MFERFTDRARKVMALANQEAQRFNHEQIDTAHILLGIVKEGSGIGANALKNLNIDLRKIRLEVERLIIARPENETFGKLPKTAQAKKMVELAIAEARENNHNYVGTEHLLLGLLLNGSSDSEDVAGKVLRNLGLKLEDVREEVLNLLGATPGRKPEAREPETVPLDPASQADQLERVRKIIATHPIHIPDLIGSRCSVLVQACLIAVSRDENRGPLVTGRKLHELLTLVLADSDLAKLDG